MSQLKTPFLSQGAVPVHGPPIGFSQPQRTAFGKEPLELDGILMFFAVFLVYSRFSEIFSMATGFQLSYTIFIVLALVAFGSILNGRDLLGATISGAMKYYTGFTVWMLLCVPLSSWRGGSVDMLRYQWIPAFLATVFAVTIIREERHFHILAKVMAMSSMTIVAASFLLGQYSPSDGRLMFFSGSLRNSNDLSVLLCSGLPFFFMPLLGKDWGRFGKIIAVPAVLLHVIIVLRTGSRAAMLSLILMLVLLFLFTSITRKVMILVLIGILSVAGAVMTPDVVIARLKSGIGMEDPLVAAEAIASRLQRTEKFWHSVSLTLEHPIFGVGPGTYLSAQAKADTDAGRRADWLTSHNTLTQVSSETGLPGFFLYTAAAMVALFRLNRARQICTQYPFMKSEANLTIAFQLSLCGIFAANLFGSNAYVFYMPMMVGLCSKLHSQILQKYEILRSTSPTVPARQVPAIPATVLSPPVPAVTPEPPRRPMSSFRAQFKRTP